MTRRIAVLTVCAVAALGASHPAQAGRAKTAGAPLTSIPISRTEWRGPAVIGPNGARFQRTVTDTTSIAVVPYNWQGLYLGLDLGIAQGLTHTSNAAPFGGFNAGAPLGFDLRPTGPMIGGQVGYLWQSANWVYGGDVEFGYLGLDRSVMSASDIMAARYGWYGAATARVGFAWDFALWYLKGGAALAEVRNSAADLAGAGVINATDHTDVAGARWGWTVGAGVEWGLTADVSAKAEYQYLDFGDRSSTNADGDVFRHRNSVQTFKLGLTYRFGGVPLLIQTDW